MHETFARGPGRALWVSPPSWNRTCHRDLKPAAAPPHAWIERPRARTRPAPFPPTALITPILRDACRARRARKSPAAGARSRRSRRAASPSRDRGAIDGLLNASGAERRPESPRGVAAGRGAGAQVDGAEERAPQRRALDEAGAPLRCRATGSCFETPRGGCSTPRPSAAGGWPSLCIVAGTNDLVKEFGGLTHARPRGPAASSGALLLAAACANGLAAPDGVCNATSRNSPKASPPPALRPGARLDGKQTLIHPEPWSSPCSAAFCPVPRAESRRTPARSSPPSDLPGNRAEGAISLDGRIGRAPSMPRSPPRSVVAMSDAICRAARRLKLYRPDQPRGLPKKRTRNKRAGPLQPSPSP